VGHLKKKKNKSHDQEDDFETLHDLIAVYGESIFNANGDLELIEQLA